MTVFSHWFLRVVVMVNDAPFVGHVTVWGTRPTSYSSRRIVMTASFGREAQFQSVYNELSEAGLSPRTVSFAHSLIQDALNQAVIKEFQQLHDLHSQLRPKVEYTHEIYETRDRELELEDHTHIP